MTQLSNQFSQTSQQGALDLQQQPSTISCQVDSTQATPLVPGQAVTCVNSLGGVPKVIAAATDASDIFGFVNYNVKGGNSGTFAAGSYLEISAFRGNVMYMTASAAIARNAQVAVVISGQKVVTATTGQTVVGRAVDAGAANNSLMRVYIDLPGVVL